jgi:hypothetical protein
MLRVARVMLILTAVLMVIALVLVVLRFGLLGLIVAWLFVFGLKPFRKDKALWEHGGAGWANEHLLRKEGMTQ